MTQSYLIFDFGGNEEAAQQAAHRIEGWKQGFRLGTKLQLKFDRQDSENARDTAKDTEGAGHIRLLVRLDFSEHEKLTYTRWFERIPAEAPFKGLPLEVVRAGDAGYEETAEAFGELK